MNNPEHQECVTMIQYLEILKTQGNKILYTHINSEMFTRSWTQKRKAKESGVVSGFPDYCLIINDQLFFIEMKKPRPILKSGKKSAVDMLSESQKIWKKYLEDAGEDIFVCYGYEEAKKVIDLAIN